MSKISLSKIGFFNPGRLSDQEIELGFIARQEEFESLLDNVLSHEPEEIPQHTVLIGQRGMGKTTLLVRLGVELKKTPHKERFLPLQYPEEQYNIDRLSKFWLNTLDALADALDLEGQKELSKELDLEIKKLSRSAPTEVYPIFQAWAKKLGRYPVLLVDNLNLIFDKISTDDQHRLRAILMSEGAPILIGASATTIQQTVEYGEPFYDAFQIRYLKKLSLDESIEVLKNLAQITGTPLHAAFSENRGRIATFHQLTGGTPRTLSMLFPLVSNGFSEEIQSDLDAVLDIITPLYKARFEELSDQMQVILDAIALHWDPIALEEIRNITQLENAKLSPQLKRLSDVGWIQRSNPGKGKGALYEISERFFNVWYLMRRSSRRQKRELYCLSKFLEVFYGESLESVAINRLNKGSLSVDDIYIDLALAEAISDKYVKNNLRKRSYQNIFKYSKDDKSVLHEFRIPNVHIKLEIDKVYDVALDLFNNAEWKRSKEKLEEVFEFEFEVFPSEIHILYGLILFRLERLQESEFHLKRSTEIAPHSYFTWHNLGNFYFETEQYQKAASNYDKAIEIDSTAFEPWFSLGQVCHDGLHKFEKAKEAYQNAAKINPNDSLLWLRLGLLHYELEEFEKAEQSYKKSLDINPDQPSIWQSLGNILQLNLSRFKDAEFAYNKAIEYDPSMASAWNGLGNLYKNNFKKYEESERAYRIAINLQNDFAAPWNGLGNLYKDHLDRFSAAEEAYKKAIEIDDQYDYPWSGLAKLYLYDLKRYEDVEEALNEAILRNPHFYSHYFELGNFHQIHSHDFIQAELAYKKATELNPDFRNAWHALGQLYYQHLKEHDKAFWAYKKAVQIDPNFSPLWEALGALYQIHFGQTKDAFSAFEKAVSLNENSMVGWYGIANLGHYIKSDFKGVEEAYLKAIKLAPENDGIWNDLGNLYLDNLKDFEKAKSSFSRCLELNQNNNFAAFNLVALYRDKLNEVEKARYILNQTSNDQQIEDAFHLHMAIFDFIDGNLGKAKKQLNQSLEIVQEALPLNTQDDWWRTGATIVKLGFGQHLLEVLEETGHDIILRPYYEAIKALMAKDSEVYFTTVAAEVREPAAKILDYMKRYNS